MSGRLFDHIDLRVTDIARAKKFYDAFLPALGFTETDGDDDYLSYAFPGDSKTAPFVWVNLDPAHRGGANRIAFWADTEEEVNRLGEIVRAAGAQVVEGPEYCFDYSEGYYAVFFEDLDANKWEICCRNARVRDPSEAPAST